MYNLNHRVKYCSSETKESDDLFIDVLGFHLVYLCIKKFNL